jgi:hypothetical protein
MACVNSSLAGNLASRSPHPLIQTPFSTVAPQGEAVNAFVIELAVSTQTREILETSLGFPAPGRV